ncbi:RNA polymerase sigma factor [Chitinophaga sp.]|uniref:RNA polymerase sigma factor n=1 Tax=Chitinophaga sp. TaxID=1869181 RepID=UPI002FDCF336
MSFNLATDEIQLIHKLSLGDRRAFELIYNQYFIRIYNFSLRFVGDRQAAEDITLETFVKLWDKRADLTDNSRLGAYLFAISRNASLNYLRDEQKRSLQHNELALLTPASSTFEEFADPRSEIYRRLYLEIEQLPGKMAAVMRLSLKGLKNGEIAAEMGLAEKTVRNLKAEAVKQLKTVLLKKELLLLLFLLSR